MEQKDSYAKGLGLEDIIPDDEGKDNPQYKNLGKKQKKPVGPPLALEIPLHPPPGQLDRVKLYLLVPLNDRMHFSMHFFVVHTTSEL